MINHAPAAYRRNCLRTLSCLSVLVLGAAQASALSEVKVDRASAFPRAEDEPVGPEQQAQQGRQALLADLDRILKATRAKLEELSSVTAMHGKLHREVEALKQGNERLVADLRQAGARHAELKSSNELAAVRIAELTTAVEVAVQEAARANEALAELRRTNAQLEEDLARAHAAREASEAKAVELAKRGDEAEAARQELAAARSARQQVGARVSELEEAAERSDAENARLKTELAEAREQLGQAVGAVVQAEEARQAAIAEAESLRAEAEKARKEMTTASIEVGRFKTANTDLRKQLASWHVNTRSAVAAARHNLIVMDDKIEELKAALALAQVGEGAPSQSEEKGEDESLSGPELPLPKAPQPFAPEAAAKPDARQPVERATALSTSN
jgi:chromosome segregation ATPase